jgi:hypothetical protein
MPDKTEITLAQILRCGALSGNVGAFIDFTDHTGQEHQLKFGLDMAQNLIAAISQAEPKVIREQAKETGAESTQAHSRKVVNYEFVLDMAKQAALVIFRFVDQTTVSVQIPRSDLRVAIESLTNILRQLENGKPLTRH